MKIQFTFDIFVYGTLNCSEKYNIKAKKMKAFNIYMSKRKKESEVKKYIKEGIHDGLFLTSCVLKNISRRRI